MNYSVKSVPLGILLSLLHASVALAGFRLPYTVEVEPTGAIPNVETNTHTAEINIAPPAAGTGSAAAEFVDVVAVGMGIDANAALLNAYSNAVQQALGLYVDAETLVQNDEIVRDKILTHSNGFIEEAKQISTSEVNGLFQVNIRAKVKRQLLMDQAKLNKIVSVQAVDATNVHERVMSHHAQIKSKEKQAQDATALLEPALMKFATTDMVQIKLLGEPETKEQDDNVNFTYTIISWIDEKIYYQAARELMAILDKIAINKRIQPVKNFDVRKSDTENYVFRWDKTFISNIRFTGFKGNEFKIAVLDWHSTNYINARWVIYSLAAITAPIKEKLINFSGQNMILQLSLEDADTNLIAIETLDNLPRYPHHSDCDDYCGGYTFFTAPHFSAGDRLAKEIDGTLKNKYEITATVAKEDLPKMKTVKIELIRE